MLEEMMENVVGRALDAMSKMERIKALPMVDNWTWLKIAAIGERAKTGQVIQEPYGSTREFLNFDRLMFLPNQLAALPLEASAQVSTAVTLGPAADRPLTVSTPLMLAAMGYGVSVPLRLKRAFAKAARAAGTATNSGEGGFVKEERDLAEHYIVQFNKAHFGNQPEQLRQADMIEIRVGQGAEPAAGYTLKHDQIGEDLREQLGLASGEDAVMPAGFAELAKPDGFRELVRRVREAGGGVPIAVKMAAGRLHEDILIAVKAGVDVIVVDGAQGGTSYSPEITINHFGIPTIMAIPQADRILRELGVRERVSLIASAGMRDGADVIKAIALGADAAYVGQAAIVAATYHQWHRMPPGTSPAEMFRYGGAQVDEFDEDQGAEGLSNFLQACTEEVRMALRVMGKSDIRQIASSDLVALDTYTAEATQVRRAF